MMFVICTILLLACLGYTIREIIKTHKGERNMIGFERDLNEKKNVTVKTIIKTKIDLNLLLIAFSLGMAVGAFIFLLV